MKAYYEAYDLRYRQVHARGLEWFDGEPTPVVGEVLNRLPLPPGAKLMEIGCGEGGDAAALLRRGFDLLATDVSPAAVAYCRGKYPQWAERFRTLDCLREDAPGRYDFIYAVAVLHMLVRDGDRQGLLGFIRRHLTPQGAGLVVVMGDGETVRATDPARAFDLHPRAVGQTGRTVEVASTSCRMVSREDFRQELLRAGLSIEEMGDTAWADVPAAMYAVVKRRG